MEVNIEKLVAFIEYAYEGLTKYPFQAFIDDKESKVATGTSYWEFNSDSTIYENLVASVSRCELEKRALCFYMNGSKNKDKIEKVRFHFVDIDSGGGTKEEQLERIMNAPLELTIIYRCWEGYKLLYQFTDASWDNTTQQALNESNYIFEKIQYQLIGYFKGDDSKRQVNNCFRLPYVNNYNEWSSDKKVYQEEMVHWKPNNVYTQRELGCAMELVG